MTTPLVDLHVHLLPGLDDGPATPEDAVALCRRAAAGGTAVAVCTPHLVTGQWDNFRERVAAGVAGLQKLLDEGGVPLRVLPGSEVFAHPALPEWVDRGEVATVADRGRHLLLELPWTALPPGLDDLIFDLQQRGLGVILAHPERYAPVQRRPELVAEWVERGVLVQLNAPHLLDPANGSAYRTARHLLERGWAHLLASDAHSARRPPDLGPMLERLAEDYGPALADQARDSAWAVAEGTAEALPPLPVRRRRRRLWWTSGRDGGRYGGGGR